MDESAVDVHVIRWTMSDVSCTHRRSPLDKHSCSSCVFGKVHPLALKYFGNFSESIWGQMHCVFTLHSRCQNQFISGKEGMHKCYFNSMASSIKQLSERVL